MLQKLAQTCSVISIIFYTSRLLHQTLRHTCESENNYHMPCPFHCRVFCGGTAIHAALILLYCFYL